MLRSLIQSLKPQDWTAFTLELMVLVLGIAISFQVSEWGNEKAERQTERQLLEGL